MRRGFLLGFVTAREVLAVCLFHAKAPGKAPDKLFDIYVPIGRKMRIEIGYGFDEIICAPREVQAFMAAIPRWVVLKSWPKTRGNIPCTHSAALRVTLGITK